MKTLKQFMTLNLFLLVSMLIYSQENYNDYSLSDKNLLFEDQFDDNSNNWEVGKTMYNNENKYIENGNYFINHKHSTWGMDSYFRKISIDSDKDFEFEIFVKIFKSVNEQYLSVSLNDWINKITANNYWFDQYVSIVFEIDKNRQVYKLYKMFENEDYKGKFVSIKNIYKLNDYNKITIRRVSKSYYYFLNEIFLIKINADLNVNAIQLHASLKSLVGIDEIKIFYLNDNVNTAFTKAKTKNTIQSYEAFIKIFPTDFLTHQAKKLLANVKWESISNTTDTTELNNFIKENPSSDYTKEAITIIEKIRKEKKIESDFYRITQNITSDDKLKKFIDSYKDSEFAKHDYFYKLIVKIEDSIVKEIQKYGPLKRYQITDIRPINDITIHGKCAIVGNGSLPISTKCCDRNGTGAIIKYIAPVSEGSYMNIMRGDLKNKIVNIKFDSDPKKASFGELDQSDNFAPGAIWEYISNIVVDGKINGGRGVVFSTGVRVGSMYDCDSNIMIDYIKEKDKIIVCPAGTSGSIHRLIGEINIGEYKFIGAYDAIYPFTFLLHKDYGYVYLRGKGSVVSPDGSKKEFK